MYGGRSLRKLDLDNGPLSKGMLNFPIDFVPDTGEDGLGLAFDIGTTTIAAILWDRSTGQLLGTQTISNPQSNHGRDVIARITYAQRSQGGLEILNKSLIKGISELTESLFSLKGLDQEQLNYLVFAGNTTMSHLLLNKNPEGLAFSPFEPFYTGSVTSSGEAFAFDNSVNVYVLPSIAGHVGGDITAGILASRLLEKEGVNLFIDLGTNGEIVLARNGQALACSTAAGPAFEAASLTCGIRAVPGAITGMNLSEGVRISTVGDQEPLGICGSGVVSVVAEMFRAGVINNRGRITTKDLWNADNPDFQIGDMLTQEGKERMFTLVEGNGQKKAYYDYPRGYT